jgi:hypothetical protein
MFLQYIGFCPGYPLIVPPPYTSLRRAAAIASIPCLSAVEYISATGGKWFSSLLLFHYRNARPAVILSVAKDLLRNSIYNRTL